jgi:molybdopterin-binding protein
MRRPWCRIRRTCHPRRPRCRDGQRFRLSARNVLEGKVVDVAKGQTTAHVRIDIGGGRLVTASITNEAGDELAWRAGDEAYAVIKASDVLVGKD